MVGKLDPKVSRACLRNTFLWGSVSLSNNLVTCLRNLACTLLVKQYILGVKKKKKKQ